MIRKIILGFFLTLVCLFVLWYFFVALKAEPMDKRAIISAYDYPKSKSLDIQMRELENGEFEFSLGSFDGQVITGQIAYPRSKKENLPVMIGIPAMGRSYVRWFNDSFKGRPTLTRVDKITDMAIAKGYVVIAIDPRFHGKRKDPNRTLRSIMNNLIYFGEKQDYESMIGNTVVDYRIILDWIDTQQNLDTARTIVVGYSMGGQIALLLSAIDDRISRVISIVPPFLDDKTALVAPINVVDRIETQSVLLISADDDEYASAKENQLLFQNIASVDKKHIIFEGGHILPSNYVLDLADQF